MHEASGEPAPRDTTCRALIPYEPSEPLERARAWAAYSPGERRRRAVAACVDRDTAALTALLTGYLLTKSRARGESSAHTLASYAAAVAHLLACWPEEALLQPTPDAGDRYLAALASAGYSRAGRERAYQPATLAARLAGAKALYRALRWARATQADPFADVRAPRDPTPRHERRFPYAEEEIAALLSRASARERVLLLLGAHGGLRIAEVLALTWDHVDLGRGTLRVVGGKGGKDRTVPLSRSLLDALTVIRPMPASGPVLATRAGGPYADPTLPRRWLRSLCARAEVPYRAIHSLRHSAGTRLSRETGNLQLVAAHLGHADVSTAAIYAKWSDEALRRAVREW